MNAKLKMLAALLFLTVSCAPAIQNPFDQSRNYRYDLGVSIGGVGGTPGSVRTWCLFANGNSSAASNFVMQVDSVSFDSPVNVENKVVRTGCEGYSRPNAVTIETKFPETTAPGRYFVIVKAVLFGREYTKNVEMVVR
jgi:hypothetical protein